LIASLILIFSSCETEVIDPAGERGVASVPGIEDMNPATFDVNDLENTYVQFNLVLEDPGVSEAIVLVSYKEEKRVEVTRVSSFPATVKIALKDVIAKLGMQLSSVAAADEFKFEVQTVQGAKTYFSSAAFNVAVVCGYDQSMVTGSYRGVCDAWGVDGPITITPDPDDPYTVYVAGLATIDGLDEDLGPLKMVINPLNFEVTAVKTVVASLVTWGAPYHNIAYEGSGKLNTCDGTYVMDFYITVSEGSFGGPFVFTFTKN